MASLSAETIKQIKDINKLQEICQTLVKVREKEAESKKKYHQVCIERVSTYYASETILSCSCFSLLMDKELFKSISLKRKFIILFGFLFPRIARFAYLSRLRYLYKKNRVIS